MHCTGNGAGILGVPGCRRGTTANGLLNRMNSAFFEYLLSRKKRGHGANKRFGFMQNRYCTMTAPRPKCFGSTPEPPIPAPPFGAQRPPRASPAPT
jgi:hypothetical protein